MHCDNTNEPFMKRALFIDRDGTIIEEPADEQIDAVGKFRFLPHVISSLSFLRQNTDYEFVMVSNQDGLGTPAYPTERFEEFQNLMLHTLDTEDVTFDDILIDKSFPEENLPTRKPGIGMLTKYLAGDYDLDNSYVIGDRETDAQLARNIGCRALILKSRFNGSAASDNADERKIYVDDWKKITEIVYAGERVAEEHRQTKETDVYVKMNLDGTGKCSIDTGLGFFNHMLEQISKHGGIDLEVKVKGDLDVDEHHTVEDTGIVLGECLLKALGNKRGIERYGYVLPMDDCLCSVALDFGGRPWLVWQADFRREAVGGVPTEMFFHFFKSFSDAAKMNLNIQAEGTNEHHKIEGIFKAVARAVKMAIRRDIFKYELPSSKGIL